jgi:hypothetical protein
MEYASVLFPRPSGGDDSQGNVYLSARGGFGMYLRRRHTFPAYRGPKLKLPHIDLLIRQLLEGLRVAGLVEIVLEAKDSAAGRVTSSTPPRDLESRRRERAFRSSRVPNEPEGGSAQSILCGLLPQRRAQLAGLEAHEHTAQVPMKNASSGKAFRKARYPSCTAHRRWNSA